MGSDLVGKKLGKFHIEKRLGQGAMGAVFKAQHSETGKFVAIKVMSLSDDEVNPNLAARFEREIKLLSQFNHRNIVRMFGSSEDRGIRFYAMELVDGPSLSALLDRKTKLPYARSIHYTVQVCEALQEMHSVGVLHRDLKPGNLLITQDHKVKLTDFGIAKDMTDMQTRELTRADHTVGTVAYMSPEQLTGGELTRKSDIYSLGIVLYRMLTGRLPFAGETMFEYMNQRALGVFPMPSSIDSSIPFEFDALMRELLAQDPKDRPRDAYVVMQKLLDIDAKAKQGTLQKTSAPLIMNQPVDTIVMPSSRLSTIVRTVTGVFGTASNKKKKKAGSYRVETVTPTNLIESPIFLVPALLLTLAILGYTFLWPKGPDSLRREADRLLATQEFDQWEKAVNQYLKPIESKYPEYAKTNNIAGMISDAEDRVARAKSQGIAKRALRANLRRPEASEAEKQYIDALILQENMHDSASAQERFRALIEIFKNNPEDKPWVQLAEEQLTNEVKFNSAADRRAAKRKQVEAALDRAKKQRDEGKLPQALQTFTSLEELYGKDRDVADLLREATLIFLSADDLFQRGKTMLASDKLEDWELAFSQYLNPFVERFPNDPRNDEVKDLRASWDLRRAKAEVAGALKSRSPSQLSADLATCALAEYLETKLHDPYSAHELLLLQPPAKEKLSEDEKRWRALLETEKRRLAKEIEKAEGKQIAGENAIAELAKLASSPASASEKEWIKAARAFYQLRPAWRPLVDKLFPSGP